MCVSSCVSLCVCERDKDRKKDRREGGKEGGQMGGRGRKLCTLILGDLCIKRTKLILSGSGRLNPAIAH